MSITVPTADPTLPAGRGRISLSAFSGLLVAMLLWPAMITASTFQPDPPPVVDRLVPPPRIGYGSWTAVSLPGSHVGVAGLGPAVVSVDTDGIWPVSLLADGRWQRLLGLPLGVEVASGVGTGIGEGFVLAGVSADRTVLYGYDRGGRFQGATTVFGIEAGVILGHEQQVVVFDRRAPDAQVVGGGRLTLPGPVVDAASASFGLVILTVDGVVHRSSDTGDEWVALGDGVVGLVGTGEVYAVGETAAVGLAAVGETLTTVPAPIGPTVAWGGRPAVYDWSADSVWVLGDDGWNRVRLWESEGFVAQFGHLVDGAPSPTVIGSSPRGAAVWRLGR